MKPGIQTTEFWANIATLVIAALTVLGIHVNRQDDVVSVFATVAAAVASAVYTWQRTRLKQSNAQPTISASQVVPALRTIPNTVPPTTIVVTPSGTTGSTSTITTPVAPLTVS